MIAGGCLFFWPACLDRYLVPRFLWLAITLTLILIWQRRVWSSAAPWHLFDFCLTAWAGLNFASLFWTFSASEGWFFALKTLLLCGVYAVTRHLLQQHETTFKVRMRVITQTMTGMVAVIIGGQLLWAATEQGLDNESLYNYASGLFGNKSLAAEFLFLLLIFNVLFVFPGQKSTRILLSLGGFLVLILLLQVRTALLALLGSGVLFLATRGVQGPDFRQKLKKMYLPAALLAMGILAVLLFGKGAEGSWAARLNPMNYLESATANERRFVWYKTDLLNAEHYWLGVGNGSWKFLVTSKNVEGGYRQSEKNVVFTRAHNDYLEVRSELGTTGALLFIVLFGGAFLLALSGLRRHPEALPTAAGLLGYAIIQYFDFPRERIEFQVVLGVLFAMSVHYSASFSRYSIRVNALVQRFFALVLGAGLVFSVYVGWMRLRGEIHLVRLLEAQAKANWRGVVAEARQAENPFFEYTDASMPIAWHEGVAHFQLGKTEQAVGAFERAYRLHPWSFQVINNYASALVKSGKPGEAIPLFEKALAINPRYDEGKFNLAYIYHQMSDAATAMEWLNKVDTIASPATAADREKNRQTIQKLQEFRRILAK
jgi:O-antigen ligase